MKRRRRHLYDDPPLDRRKARETSRVLDLLDRIQRDTRRPGPPQKSTGGTTDEQ